MASSLGSRHGHSMELHWDFSLGGSPWNASMASSLGFHHGHSMELHWDFSLGKIHGMLPWLAHCVSPWPFHGIALGLLIGGSPWNASMASSLGSHHGRSMELHWDFSLGEIHGMLPWLAHWDLTMAIPWNCIGTSHWGKSMECFHG